MTFIRNNIKQRSSAFFQITNLFSTLQGMLKLSRNNLERFSRLSKEGFWIVLGQILAVLGSLVGVRILTGILSPVAYGELALGITVATLANQIVFGPLGNGATRFYAPALEKSDLRGFLHAVRRHLLSATGVIIIVILLMTVGMLIFGRKEWIFISVSALIFAVFSGYNSILSGIQNAARQRAIVALHQAIESWARFLAAAGLVLWLEATSTMAMFGYVISAILVLGSQYIFFRNTVPVHVTQIDNPVNWSQQISKYSWPMVVTGVMSWGFFASQRWALELFTSTEDVGYFSAIFQIGFTPFSLVGGALLSLIMPIVFSRAGDGEDKHRLNLVTKLIVRFCLVAFLVVLLVTVFGTFFHDHTFQLLVAEQYRKVSHYFPYAILSAGLFQISLFLSTIILVSTKTRILLPINTIGNSLIIILNFIFTKYYGIGGLFFSMVIGSIIHILWNIFNVYKVTRDA